MIRQLFCNDWTFGYPVPFFEMLAGKEKDSTPVTLPHDFTISMTRAPGGLDGVAVGFYPGGSGVYEKTLHAPKEWENKTVILEFEGVYKDADIYLNGDLLKKHFYGYTSFHVDLTDWIRIGQENKISVTARNDDQPNSRWYSGSGIYRPVHLMVAGAVHVNPWGVFVTTPVVDESASTVAVKTEVRNCLRKVTRARVRSTIYDGDGMPVAVSEAPVTLKPGSTQAVKQTMVVAPAQLWSCETANLYKLATELTVDGEVTDRTETAFGIRSISFDARHGFRLNGRQVNLKGGCIHHGNGPLGACAFRRAEERRVELHKAAGFNAIRSAHNPPSVALLDACDRLGMLVIDENFDCWRNGKQPHDYHQHFEDRWQEDTASMVFRDRNHPCVIMYSIGNEIIERSGNSQGGLWARRLAEYVRSLDNTRAITSALNGTTDLNEPIVSLEKVLAVDTIEGPGNDDFAQKAAGMSSAPVWGGDTEEYAATLDVVGYNYLSNRYKMDGILFPNRVIYGSETYAKTIDENWERVKTLPYVIGDFTWTSWDYIGESGVGHIYHHGETGFLADYPWHLAYCGDFDICGFRRPQSYYREIVWGGRIEPYIAVYRPEYHGKKSILTPWAWDDVTESWTWPGYEGRPVDIDVYSDAEEVELFINEKSLGRKKAGIPHRYTSKFTAVYKPGTMTAVAYAGGREVSRSEIETSGPAAKLKLEADRSELKADGQDLAYITITVIDAEGRRVIPARDQIAVEVMGKGILAGYGTGDPVSEEGYTGSVRSAYEGRALAIVRTLNTPGQINVSAKCEGLQSSDMILISK